MPVIKLKAPNPDTNGVKVEGYDRIERNKATGLFDVHDSNLAAKLQGPPWGFTVDSSDNTKSPPNKVGSKATEEKTLDEMNKGELADYINERSPEDGQVDKKDYNLGELLQLAKDIKAAADAKTNPQL